MIARRAPPAAALILALTCMAAAAQDRSESEATLPDDETEAGAIAPTSSAAAHQAALCAQLGVLVKQGAPAPERDKAAETRKALHCAEPGAVAPVAGSSSAPGAARPGGR